MNRFLKKNTFLVGVLGLTVFLVIVLLVFSIIQLSSWKKADDQVNAMRKSVTSLLRQKPAAVAGNIALLRQDIDGYTLAATRLEDHFGQPYRIALRKFIAALNLSIPADPDEESEIEPSAEEPSAQKPVDPALLAEYQLQKQQRKFEEVFREFWQKEKSTQAPPDTIYRRLRYLGSDPDTPIHWTTAAWDNAFKVFCKEVQKVTLEPINENNAPEILLSALGRPRDMNNKDDVFDVFVRTMRSKIVEQFEQKKVLPKFQFSDGSSSRSGGMGYVSSRGSSSRTTPLSDKVAKIRDWENTADLLSRVANSGINTIEAFSSHSPFGTESGDYRYHAYTIVFRGSLASIRMLMNDLMKAYQENRVYVIRSLKICKLDDQAQALIDYNYGVLDKNQEGPKYKTEMPDASRGMPAMRRSRGGMDRAAKKENANTAQQFFESGTYGEVVIGRNELCEVTMTVDYVTFIKNELKDE